MHCLRNGPWLRRNAPTVRETTTRKTTRTLFSFLFLRYLFNFLRKKALVLIFGPKMSSGQTNATANWMCFVLFCFLVWLTGRATPVEDVVEKKSRGENGWKSGKKTHLLFFTIPLCRLLKVIVISPRQARDH
jgi:hypothetical protein